MSVELFVYLLTGLAGVIVVLTRVRLSMAGGRASAGVVLPWVHAVSGVIGLVSWAVFLVAPESTPLGSALMGVIGLFFLWVTAGVGLLTLTRWLRSSGSHAGEVAGDSWSSGPALSVFAQVSCLAIACYFTWCYLIQVV